MKQGNLWGQSIPCLGSGLGRKLRLIMPSDQTSPTFVPIEATQDYSSRWEKYGGNSSNRPHFDPKGDNAGSPGMLRRNFLRCLACGVLGSFLSRHQSSGAPPLKADQNQNVAIRQDNVSSLTEMPEDVCLTERDDDHDLRCTLSYSVDAEMGVLKSMLTSPTDAISEFVEVGVSEAWFYHPAHATIFAVLVGFWSSRTPADAITLVQMLREREQLDMVGGPAFIVQILTFTPTAEASDYLETVREKYALRLRQVRPARRRLTRRP